MYLVRKLSGSNILNHFTLSAAADFWWVRVFGLIESNVPKERLVRLYLDINPQDVPTVQNKK